MQSLAVLRTSPNKLKLTKDFDTMVHDLFIDEF